MKITLDINSGSRNRRNFIYGGVVAMVSLILSFGMSGCSSESEGDASSGSQSGDSKKPKIALVMKSLANEFFLTMQSGAEQHQKGHAETYDLISNGIKDEQDVTRQVQLVEQMIAQKVDAIVIAPADSKALIGVSKKAQDQGIVVINIDNKFDAGVLGEKGMTIPFVGPDNRKGARLAGDKLASVLSKGDEVAILEGAPGAINGIQRKLGFEDAMKEHGMKIVSSQSAHWETDKANKLVAALVTEHTGLKAILACNDSMALGAVAALKAAGKEGEIHVVGFDNISAVQSLIREGKVLCTVDQNGGKLAVFGIEYALEMLKSGQSPADRETPVDLITIAELQ